MNTWRIDSKEGRRRLLATEDLAKEWDIAIAASLPQVDEALTCETDGTPLNITETFVSRCRSLCRVESRESRVETRADPTPPLFLMPVRGNGGNQGGEGWVKRASLENVWQNH